MSDPVKEKDINEEAPKAILGPLGSACGMTY